MIAEIQRHRLEVLVVDVITYVYDESIDDENAAAQVQRWCASVARIAEAARVAPLLITHATKAVRDRAVSERQRGSGTLGGLADTVAHLARSDDGELRLEIVPKDGPVAEYRLRYDQEADQPWTCERAEDAAGIVGESRAVQEVRGAIVAEVLRLHLERRAGIDRASIVAATGMTDGRVKGHLPTLVASGRLKVVAGGGRGKPTLYYPAGGATP